MIDDTERQRNHLTRSSKASASVAAIPLQWTTQFPFTHGWPDAGGHASAFRRDLLLVIGDEIIEASVTQRARYFEFRACRRLLQEYFLGGARWTAVPTPLMSVGTLPLAHGPPFDDRNGPTTNPPSTPRASPVAATTSSGSRTLSATSLAPSGSNALGLFANA